MTGVLRKVVLGATFVGAIATVAAAQVASPPILNSLEVKRLVASGTPADDVKLSAHFAALADRYEADANEHAAMARGVAGSRNQALATSTKAHCDRIAASDRDAAVTLRGLASFYADRGKGVAANVPPDAARFEGGAGAPAPTRDEVRGLVAGATTATDHRLLAEYFEALSTDYLAVAAEHAAMVKANLPAKTADGPSHCQKLVNEARENARDANEMAALHRKLAESVR
jgi:hypothetical protein